MLDALTMKKAFTVGGQRVGVKLSCVRCFVICHAHSTDQVHFQALILMAVVLLAVSADSSAHSGIGCGWPYIAGLTAGVNCLLQCCLCRCCVMSHCAGGVQETVRLSALLQIQGRCFLALAALLASASLGISWCRAPAQSRIMCCCHECCLSACHLASASHWVATCITRQLCCPLFLSGSLPSCCRCVTAVAIHCGGSCCSAPINSPVLRDAWLTCIQKRSRASVGL